MLCLRCGERGSVARCGAHCWGEAGCLLARLLAPWHALTFCGRGMASGGTEVAGWHAGTGPTEPRLEASSFGVSDCCALVGAVRDKRGPVPRSGARCNRTHPRSLVLRRPALLILQVTSSSALGRSGLSCTIARAVANSLCFIGGHFHPPLSLVTVEGAGVLDLSWIEVDRVTTKSKTKTGRRTWFRFRSCEMEINLNEGL